MCRHERYMQSAIAAAEASPGAGGARKDNFRIGAAIYAGSRLLITQHNSYQSHVALLRSTPWPFRHAESSAIIRLGLDNCPGCTLYIARVLKDSSLALAKPCKSCMEWIRQAQFKAVYFTNETGAIERLDPMFEGYIKKRADSGVSKPNDRNDRMREANYVT